MFCFILLQHLIFIAAEPENKHAIKLHVLAGYAYFCVTATLLQHLFYFIAHETRP